MIAIDTSAFMAYLNEDDQFHAQAVAQWQALLAGDEPAVCNNYVLVETMALTQRRFGLEVTRRLQHDLLPLLAIHWVDAEIHQQAVAALLVANRRQLSLVDCSIMATMRELGINRVFTFDAHFAEYGFMKLP